MRLRKVAALLVLLSPAIASVNVWSAVEAQPEAGCFDWAKPSHADSRQAGHSGHRVLDTGREAMLARVALLETARKTFDAQYYIWNDDKTGRVMADRVVTAAERGVHVRLLIDDYGTPGRDEQLATLDAHPNIQIRVYNPFSEGFRSGLRKWASFALGFAQLNRRMHSKTFIVDGCAVITGGRNIGDEYFDADNDLNHRDRDLLSAGPVVGEISSQFEQMWSSEFAVSIADLVDAGVSDAQLAAFVSGLGELVRGDIEALYALPCSWESADALLSEMFSGAIWARTDFYYNAPTITDLKVETGAAVGGRLVQLLSEAKREVLVESAYFTIRDEMLDTLMPYLGSGLDIRVLTNSLSTTDVWLIHAGYTRNREKILRRGVQLYEWRSDAASCPDLIDNPAVDCETFLYSLHAKTVVFDREIAFVGSFNLNPRSRLLNTETALVVYSPELAAEIADAIALAMEPQNSWRLAFAGEDEQLRWFGEGYEAGQSRDHEPHTGWFTRFKARLVAFLPLEKYW